MPVSAAYQYRLASNRSICSVLSALVRFLIIQIEEHCSEYCRVRMARIALHQFEVTIASKVVVSETKHLIHRQSILTTNWVARI